MLGKIRSDFSLKVVISNLVIKILLKTIISNKKLQNKLNINILNYKAFSWKYKIDR